MVTAPDLAATLSFLPRRKVAMSLDAVQSAYQDLTSVELETFHTRNGLELTARSMPHASSRVNDAVWLIIVGTLAVIAVGALGALALFIYDGKSTDVIASVVTLVLGVFGGLLAPSPVAQK